MISIEKVNNGFVVRIEEGDDDYTMVLQKEYDSMNMALGSVCKLLLDHWQDDEHVKVKLDIGGQ